MCGVTANDRVGARVVGRVAVVSRVKGGSRRHASNKWRTGLHAQCARCTPATAHRSDARTRAAAAVTGGAAH